MKQILVDPYIRKAKLVKIVDGDTIDVLVDLGFNTYRKIRLRLSRVNTKEMKNGGKIWKEFTQNWFANNVDVVIKTNKDRKDKWSRYLAEVFINDRSLVDDLIVAGCPLYKKAGT